MVHGIFYMHQAIGMCAGVCACDCTHQMEKTYGEDVFANIDSKHLQQFDS